MPNHSPLGVVVTFLSASFLTSCIFAFCVSNPQLEIYWFRTEEIWTIPTTKLWLLTSVLLSAALVTAAFVVYVRRWVAVPGRRIILAALLLIVTFPTTVYLFEGLSGFSRLILFRSILTIVSSVALLILTQRWYWLLALGAVLLSLLTPIIGGLSYFVTSSMGWFEAAKYFVHSSVVAVLFSSWMIKTSRSKTK